MHDHAATVDIAGLEGPQFIAAQAGGIKGGDHGPVLQVGGVIEDGGDLFSAQHAWQLGPPPRPGYSFIEPRLVERLDVEKLQGGPVHLDGVGGGLLVSDQIKQVIADLFGA